MKIKFPSLWMYALFLLLLAACASFQEPTPTPPAGLLLGLLLIQTYLQLIRCFNNFPMPEFLANAIDNPIRRKIQPPGEMPLRKGNFSVYALVFK